MFNEIKKSRFCEIIDESSILILLSHHSLLFGGIVGDSQRVNIIYSRLDKGSLHSGNIDSELIKLFLPLWQGRLNRSDDWLYVNIRSTVFCFYGERFGGFWF